MTVIDRSTSPSAKSRSPIFTTRRLTRVSLVQPMKPWSRPEMAEIDLLRSLPKTKRNVQKRAEGKDETVVAIAKQYGEMYWDGPRQYGYGGYRYDGPERKSTPLNPTPHILP